MDEQRKPLGGPWTRHGHAVAGVTVAGPGGPERIRCGGVNHCPGCQEDARQLRAEATATVPLEALRALVQRADGWRSQADSQFVCTTAEQEASDLEFQELVGALGVSGLED